ncbi:lipase family protein [Aquihabitans daechungensis]|uniref:lipase family protein n=1 Tax=Aquihabitans daechungensis TaxID=1052257 RepID=UPI003B9ED2AE
MAPPSVDAPPRLRGLAVACSAVALAALLGACSGSASDGGATGPTTAPPEATTTTASDAPPPEQFDGAVDEFYEVPDPLPAGKPGELIRVQDLGEDDGVATVRVMYHSRDAEERDRAVTGIISYPTAEAPEGGWPVTSLANGTVGLASPCALSRNGNPAGDWGVEGVHAVTDYVGLGPVGEIHPYLSGPSEGNSVIDAVRAARNLPDAHAGKEWFSVGHSQGGHGALFAGERADTYAPELDLLGTVSLAPATELTKTYGPVDEVVTRIVGVMMLYGASSEHPEIRFEDYAGPELLAAADVFEEACLDDIINAMAPIPAETFYANDPLETDPAKSLLELNQPGLVATDSPLFLAQGTEDVRVHVQRTKDFFERVCALGQVTELLIAEGEDHGTIVPEAAPEAAEWMNDRLAGKDAPDSCP